MLKRIALKKITVICLSLLFLLLIYLFPKSDNYTINTTLTYSSPKTRPIYLIDNNDYVSRFEIISKIDSDDALELVDEVIENLTIDSKNSSHIPNNFKKIIPRNTKVLSKDLTDGLLKINFSKELTNVSMEMEEKLIESLIYSLTEINGIDKIMIFVEGTILKELPNSHKSLPNVLDRSYGINKVYELESMKDVTKITTYYISKMDNYFYYTPVTTISNSKNEKIEIIIEKLKSFPTYNVNLVSYLVGSAELLNYEILENSVNLSFNNDILSLNDNSIIEEVKYSIALSVRDTYNIGETIFYVDGVLIDAFFI